MAPAAPAAALCLTITAIRSGMQRKDPTLAMSAEAAIERATACGHGADAAAS